MSRREELLQLIAKNDKDVDIKARRLIDEVVFLEEKMEELRALPFIRVDPKDPMHQKATPAAKQYKEFLQQYNNSMRVLFWLSGGIEESEEESPLRKWAKSREDMLT